MGNIVLFIATSLDGFIATADGGVSWLDPFNAAETDFGYGDFTRRVGANIQGARTYRQVLTFEGSYPYEGKSFVVTHGGLEAPPGADIEFVQGSLGSIADRAKASTSKDVWLVGGGELVQGFLRDSLIDEMIISLMPVTLGEGISLFGQRGAAAQFSLADVRMFERGVVSLHYHADRQ